LAFKAIDQLSETRGAEGDTMDRAGAGRRLHLMAEVFPTILADIRAASGVVKHVAIADVGPVVGEREVRCGSARKLNTLT
jgi:hypothetical protein